MSLSHGSPLTRSPVDAVPWPAAPGLAALALFYQNPVMVITDQRMRFPLQIQAFLNLYCLRITSFRQPPSLPPSFTLENMRFATHAEEQHGILSPATSTCQDCIHRMLFIVFFFFLQISSPLSSSYYFSVAVSHPFFKYTSDAFTYTPHTFVSAILTHA